jgi:hypothetical protein
VEQTHPASRQAGSGVAVGTGVGVGFPGTAVGSEPFAGATVAALCAWLEERAGQVFVKPFCATAWM